jgi:hypothetical protein
LSIFLCLSHSTARTSPRAGVGAVKEATDRAKACLSYWKSALLLVQIWQREQALLTLLRRSNEFFLNDYHCETLDPSAQRCHPASWRTRFASSSFSPFSFAVPPLFLCSFSATSLSLFFFRHAARAPGYETGRGKSLRSWRKRAGASEGRASIAGERGMAEWAVSGSSQ